MIQEEIKAFLEQLRIDPKDIDNLVSLFHGIIFTAKGHPNISMSKTHKTDIKKIHEIVKNYYMYTFSTLEDKDRIIMVLEDAQNLRHPYLKYIVSSMILADKSPWNSDKIESLFRSIPDDDAQFEMYMGIYIGYTI